jgi:hypothetical protein
MPRNSKPVEDEDDDEYEDDYATVSRALSLNSCARGLSFLCYHDTRFEETLRLGQ